MLGIIVPIKGVHKWKSIVYVLGRGFIGRACKIDRMAGITLFIAKFRQEKVYCSK